MNVSKLNGSHLLLKNCFWAYKIKSNFSDYFSFPHCPPESMPTNFTSQEVVMSELIFLLVELYGTVYQTLSVLLASLFLRDVLELLILVSF